MEEQASGLVYGSYPIQIPTLPTLPTKRSGSTGYSKPNQEFKINDFVDKDELPDVVKGFSKKTSQFYAGKHEYNMKRSDYNVRFQAALMADYGGDVISFWDDYEDVVRAAQFDVLTSKIQMEKMYNEIQNEFVRYEEGDLSDMDEGQVLHDNAGNFLKADAVLRGQKLDYMLENHKKQTYDLFGIDESEIPNNIKNNPEALSEWIGENKDPVIMTKYEYMWIENKMPYGIKFEEIDALDMNGYWALHHQVLSEIGTTTGTDNNGRTTIKTNSEQIDASVEYVHNNLAPVENNILRARNSFLSTYAMEDEGAAIGASPIQKEKWNTDYNMITEMLNAAGFDSYDSVFTNNSDFVTIIEKKGNKEWTAMAKDTAKMYSALNYADYENNGKILSQDIRDRINLNRLKDHEKKMFKQWYNVDKVTPRQKMLTDLERAAGGDINHLPQAEKMIVTSDEKTDITAQAKSGQIGPVVNDGTEFSNTTKFFDDNKTKDGKLAYDKEVEFFHGENATERLDNYVLAKSKGQYIDRYLKYLKDGNVVAIKEHRSRAKSHGPTRDLFVGGVKRSMVGEMAGTTVRRSLGIKPIDDGSELPETHNVLNDKEYVDMVWFETKEGYVGLELGIDEVIQTQAFKDWVENKLTDEEKKDFYDVEDYVYNFVKDTPRTGNIEDYVMYNVNKEAGEGNFPVNIRILSQYEGRDGLTGTTIIEGMQTHFDPATLTETSVPITGPVLMVDGVIKGVNKNDRDQEYAIALVAVHEDVADDLEFQDHEGGMKKYSSIYKKEKWGFEALLNSRPRLVERYYKETYSSTYKNIDKNKGDQMVVIPLLIKITQDFWYRSIKKNKGELPYTADNSNNKQMTAAFPLVDGTTTTGNK